LYGICSTCMKELRVLKPDILFLDIQMPQMTGLEFVDQFRPQMPIICTTAYSEFAVESFDLDIVDYILKPLQYDRFLRAIDRVYKKMDDQRFEEPISKSEYIFVRAEGSLQKVTLKEVLYLKSIQNYVKIVSTNGNVIVHRTLKSFEDQLPVNTFLKVQKSYIVNLNRIDRFDGYLLYLEDKSVPVSRELIADVRNRLLKS